VQGPGHKSVEFIDYWSTYSPVVSWSTVRLLIIITLINDWHMRSIDFVLAYPQAPVKTDIYMFPPKVPPSFVIPDLPTAADRANNVYKLIQNLYGLKDAGKTWYDHLRKGLLSRGWRQSEVDSCLFTKGGIILVVYVDDAILISPFKTKIDKEIASLQEDYDLTDEGELQDYLGIRFDRRLDGSLKLTQPRMIERVLEIVGLKKDDQHVKLHDTPASEHKLLDNDPHGAFRTQQWNYRSAVGCLSYLQAMIRPDITMAVQQCARFCNIPQREHEEAVKRICRYLLKTKDQGIILRSDRKRGLECFVDADWAGSWQERSSNDPLSSHSRTGFVILYAGCPIIWGSKMQQLIALSTTEAEYIALSTALRDVIHVIHLLEELHNHGFNIHHPTPKVTCRTFEDNKSCIEIATNHKTRARTKHLSVRLHHFRSHVVNKTITIEHVSTKEQIADMFTKPLPRDQFEKLRDRLLSWPSHPS
jgi:Reverse transcriptase (RNA-dependent DNA polymerase)